MSKSSGRYASPIEVNVKPSTEGTVLVYTTDGKEIFNGGFDRAIKVLIPSRWLGGLTAVSENEIDAIKLR